MDVGSIQDCVELVRKIGNNGGDADEISTKLESLFARFPPDDEVLQRVSLYQQQCSQTGMEEEFCTTLLFVVLMNHVTTYSMRQKPVAVLQI